MTKAKTANLDNASVEQACRQLRLPTIAAQFERLAQEATKSNQTHVRYLAELLSAEVDERERQDVDHDGRGQQAEPALHRAAQEGTDEVAERRRRREDCGQCRHACASTAASRDVGPTR